jgi:hypothetical protein
VIIAGRSRKGSFFYIDPEHSVPSFRGLKSGINLRSTSERFVPVIFARLSTDSTAVLGARNIKTSVFFSSTKFLIETSIKNLVSFLSTVLQNYKKGRL